MFVFYFSESMKTKIRMILTSLLKDNLIQNEVVRHGKVIIFFRVSLIWIFISPIVFHWLYSYSSSFIIYLHILTSTEKILSLRWNLRWKLIRMNKNTYDLQKIEKYVKKNHCWNSWEAQQNHLLYVFINILSVFRK